MVWFWRFWVVAIVVFWWIPANALSYRPGEILVKLTKPLPSITTFQSTGKDPLLSRFELESFKTIGPKGRPLSIFSFAKSPYPEGILKLILKNPDDMTTALAALRTSGTVEWAQPNYIYKAFYTPNDPGLSKQTNLSLLNMSKAWNITQGNAAVIVAVIDTGIHWQHDDLKNVIWKNPGEIDGDGIDNDQDGYIDDVRGWNFVSIATPNKAVAGERYNPDNDPSDRCGHGTHVSGIIAAEIDNGHGIAGLSRCTIMPLRAGYAVYTTLNNGQPADMECLFSSDAIIEAIAFAVSHGAKVINMSLGGNGVGGDIAFRSSVENAIANGVYVVAAAGNEKLSIDAANVGPAIFPGVIAVSATTTGGSFDTSYSNYGPSIFVGAPGTNIWSCYINEDSLSDTNLYGELSGTSQAAPHVAGLIGLMLGFNSNVNVKSVLERSSLDSGTPGRDSQYGFGLIQPLTALLMSDPTPPTITHTPVTTAGLEDPIRLTATATDNVTVNVTMFYQTVTTTQTSDWTSVPMAQTGSTWVCQLPTPSSLTTEIHYYLAAKDGNPDNTQTLPVGAPSQSYIITLQDRSGPSFTSVFQDGDIVDPSDTLRITLTDPSGVSANSLTVRIETDNTRALDSTEYLFSPPTLTVPLQALSLSSGLFKIRLQAQDTEGNLSDKTWQLMISGSIPFDLFGPDKTLPILNAPNPFNPSLESTKICYQLTQPASVDIRLYALDRRLVTHFHQDDSSGYHEVSWDGRDTVGSTVPNGVYICVIQATTDTQKVTKITKIAVLR